MVENFVWRIGSREPLHDPRKSGIGLAPGNLYVRGKCGSETLLERPKEGSSDWRVVLCRNTVAAMPAAEIANGRQDGIQLVETADGRRQHTNQLDLLSGKVGREQRSDFRRDLEEPIVEEIGGFGCDGGNRFEAGLHKCDLFGRHGFSVPKRELYISGGRLMPRHISIA